MVEGKFSKARASPFSFYKHMITLYNSYIKLRKRAGPGLVNHKLHGTK